MFKKKKITQVPLQYYNIVIQPREEMPEKEKEPNMETDENVAAATNQNSALFQENINRSQNEQVLYSEWKKVTNEKNQLNLTIASMQKQIKDLEQRLSQTQAQNNENTSKTLNKATSDIEYFTDEEELAKETEWIRVKNYKKRKMDTSLSPPQNHQNVPNEIKQKTKKEPAPPPVIVDAVNNFSELHDKLRTTVSNLQMKIISNDNIKINVTDDESYRNLTSMLNKDGISWYSFENKQNRPIKVIVKNLHHSCEPLKIVNELRNRGYKAVDAVNKLKWKTKKPLNMFMLVFRQDEDINKIFKITDILGIRVEIQPIKKSKLVPQCKRCQAYGHTQKYCSKEARCVKCTGKHLTNECKKPNNVQPKCIHCGENHPANYRGCIVAKEMQQIKNNLMKKPSLSQKPVRENQQKISNRPVSYSQAVTGTLGAKANAQRKTQDSNSTDQALQMILDKLNKQEEMFSKFEERLTKLEQISKGAIPKQRNA